MEKWFKNIRKEKEKARSAGTSSYKNSYRPAWKCFRCGSEDHLITECPKPPKDSEKRRKSEKSNVPGRLDKRSEERHVDQKILEHFILANRLFKSLQQQLRV